MLASPLAASAESVLSADYRVARSMGPGNKCRDDGLGMARDWPLLHEERKMPATPPFAAARQRCAAAWRWSAAPRRSARSASATGRCAPVARSEEHTSELQS